MATSSTLPRLIIRLQRLPDDQLLAAVKAVKKVAVDEVKRDVGGDQRMSNVGRKGIKLGAADNWRRGRKVADVWGRPPGPWAWLERGTDPHTIRRRRGGKRRAARGRIRVGSEWRSGPVEHKGARAKRTWSRVKRRAPKVMRSAAVGALHKVVRGG